MSHRFTIVRIALGGLLLAAAGLKLYGLSVSAIPRVGWFSQPWVQLAAVEWELVLGLWLLSGSYPRAAWLAALGTFAAFAAVSGYLGWIGVVSCGCFGTIHTSPWWAFGVDSAAVAALIGAKWDSASAQIGSTELPHTANITVPSISPVVQTRTAMQKNGQLVFRVASVGVGTALILIGLSFIGVVKFGSLTTAIAAIRGETVGVPEYVDFGTCRPGARLQKDILVTNWTTGTIRLVGGTSDCSCIATEDLPLAIPAGETRSIRVTLKLSESDTGLFNRFVILRTDLARRQTVLIRVGCRVMEK